MSASLDSEMDHSVLSHVGRAEVAFESTARSSFEAASWKRFNRIFERVVEAADSGRELNREDRLKRARNAM